MNAERAIVVWCADGPLTAPEYERVVEAVEELVPAVAVLRPGAFAIRARGPARYFGGECSVVERLGGHVADRCGARVLIGIADGVFAAELAAMADRIVPPGESPAFLAGLPVATLGRPALTGLLRRLGIRTLGDYAALPVTDVLARFGADAAAAHRLATGRGATTGWAAALGGGTAAGWGTAMGGCPAPAHAPAATGGSASVGTGCLPIRDRAIRALTRVQGLLGQEAVTTAVLRGGRGQADRIRLVPFGEDRGSAKASGPWPGRLPAPSPATVYTAPLPAAVCDIQGSLVGVTGRLTVTGLPATVAIHGTRPVMVTGWAGPWPVDERWWAEGAQTRRYARFQIVLSDSRALLLHLADGRWAVAALYD